MRKEYIIICIENGETYSSWAHVASAFTELNKDMTFQMVLKEKPKEPTLKEKIESQCDGDIYEHSGGWAEEYKALLRDISDYVLKRKIPPSFIEIAACKLEREDIYKELGIEKEDISK